MTAKEAGRAEWLLAIFEKERGVHAAVQARREAWKRPLERLNNFYNRRMTQKPQIHF